MARSIEEKELGAVSYGLISALYILAYFGDDEGLDKHNNTAGHHRGQGHKVESTEYVQNDVARTGQVFC